jgi:hypothetical protein
MEPNERLETWKEIAAYLKRDVRTVQRWEADEDLPVHRHHHKARGSVYALRHELDLWRSSRDREMFGPELDAAPRWPSVVGGGGLVAAGLAALFLLSPAPRPGAPVAPPHPDAPRLFGEVAREGGALVGIPVNGVVHDIALTQDGRTLVARACRETTSSLVVVDTSAWVVRQTLDDLGPCGRMVAAGRSGRVFASDGPDLLLIETPTGAVRRIQTPATRIRGLALAPDERTVYAAAVFAGLFEVDVETGVTRALSRLPCPIQLALAPVGQLLYVSYQCSGPGGRRGHDVIEVFNTAGRRAEAAFTNLPNVGGDVELSPDGAYLWADGSDACHSPHYDHAGCPEGPGSVINVLRTADRMLVRTLRVGGTDEYDTRLSFSPDGARVVAGHRQTTVLSTATLAAAEASSYPLWSNVVFSPDGQTAYGAIGDPGTLARVPIGVHPAPPPGITARWTADGVPTDSAGGNDVAHGGQGAFAPGRLGLAFRVDAGPPIRFEMPTNLDLDRGRFTAAAWIRLDEGTRGVAETVIEYAALDPDAPFVWHLSVEADRRPVACFGRLRDHRCGADGDVLVHGRTPLRAREWYHLAVTRTDDVLTLYVDGQSQGAAGGLRAGSSSHGSLWLRLGSDEAGAAPFRGLIDEIELYGRSLAPEEIRTRGK